MAGFTAYTRATRWLYARLTTPTAITGVTAGVHEDAVPEGLAGATDVWIEFEAMDPGLDLAEVAAHRIWTEFSFLVRAMKRGRSYQELEGITDEIDNRLHRADGTVSDGRILSCIRSEVGSSEAPESFLRQGVEYRALGQIYNVLIQPLA